MRDHPNPGERQRKSALLMTSHLRRRAIGPLLSVALIAAALLSFPGSARAATMDVVGRLGPITESWTYGAAAPAARLLTISAETAGIRLIGSDARGSEGECRLYDGHGYELAWAENYGELDYITLSIGPGAIRAGSGARYRIDCWAGYIDNKYVSYELYEGPGAGRVLDLDPDQATAITTAYARRYCDAQSDYDSLCPPVPFPQSLHAGDRVTLKGLQP
jgi:hypothetical protein